MKLRQICVSVLSATLFSAGPVFAARDMSESEITGNIHGAGPSYFPPVVGQDFHPINIGFNTGLDVGCGLDVEHALNTYLNVDYEHLIEYLKSNAMGLAVNYIVYSNPTLYTLLQDLKQGADWMINMNMFTCQSIRKAADQARWSDPYYAEAKKKCLQSNSLVNCENDAMLAKYMDDAVGDRKRRLSSVIPNAPQGGSVKITEFLTADLALDPATKKLLDKYVGSPKLTDSNVDSEVPEGTLAREIKTKQEANQDRLNELLTDLRQNGRAAVIQKLDAMAQEEGLQRINIADLVKLSNFSSKERGKYVRDLSLRQSYGQVFAEMRTVHTVLATGLSSEGKVRQLTESERTFFNERLRHLGEMLKYLEFEMKATEEQNAFLDKVYELSPKAAPSVR